MKVGLIGYGQIGRSVAASIAAGEVDGIELSTVLVRDATRTREPVDSVRTTTNPAELLDSDARVIVEVAGHPALRQFAVRVLDAGKDLMTICPGAFADTDLLTAVERAARQNGRRVLVPSGAIGGLDMISAAALGPLDSVMHTTRKHPRAFRADQLADPPTDEARLLFDGSAREGVTRFPDNVNVAAAVSMAGIGLDRTRLRIFADPAACRNTHQLEVHGYFGSLRLEVENEPTEKHNTGRVVALSVTKALRNLCAPIVIGL